MLTLQSMHGVAVFGPRARRLGENARVSQAGRVSATGKTERRSRLTEFTRRACWMGGTLDWRSWDSLFAMGCCTGSRRWRCVPWG